jgi:hypothetical protein
MGLNRILIGELIIFLLKTASLRVSQMDQERAPNIAQPIELELSPGLHIVIDRKSSNDSELLLQPNASVTQHH